MLDFKVFIADEMAFAPDHPLGEYMERSLPDFRVASQPEIWEIQRRDRIPGIVKRLIPMNVATAWEYWWCVPGRILLPEDVEVLKSDRPRMETILAKLLWLLGGHCFDNNSRWHGEAELLYEWQQVVEFAHNSGLNPDVLDIDFMPSAIAQVNLSHPHDRLSANSKQLETTPNYVAVEPGHWHIEFFQIQPIAGGFILQEPKPACSCQIWTGKPFIKHLQTGEIITRYDLGVSTPIDITSHPWLSSSQEDTSSTLPLGAGKMK